MSDSALLTQDELLREQPRIQIGERKGTKKVYDKGSDELESY